jgi:hypothetical protein
MNKLIFFYSDIYTYFKNHIIKNLDKYFIIEPILIEELNAKKDQHTFFGGVSIKIELVIQKIKENLGKFIIFTDATIFINEKNCNQLSDFFDFYKNYDLCFPNNLIGEHLYNIGIMLINCNENTLDFFENVLIVLKASSGWDQDIVNKCLSEKHKLKIGLFSEKKIVCGYHLEHNLKDEFFIFKSFINHTPNVKNNYNKRIQIFYDANLISFDEYQKNIIKD